MMQPCFEPQCLIPKAIKRRWPRHHLHRARKQLRQISSFLSNFRSDAMLRSSSLPTPGGKSCGRGWRWPIGALYRSSSLGDCAAFGFAVGAAAPGCAIAGTRRLIEIIVNAASAAANLRARTDNVGVGIGLGSLVE